MHPKGVILFVDEFGNDGITLPIMEDINGFTEPSTKVKFVKSVFQDDNQSYSYTDTLKDKKLKCILKDINSNGLNSINNFQLKNGTDFILIYDKVLIKINCNGSDWRHEVLIKDFYCTTSILFGFFFDFNFRESDSNI